MKTRKLPPLRAVLAGTFIFSSAAVFAEDIQPEKSDPVPAFSFTSINGCSGKADLTASGVRQGKVSLEQAALSIGAHWGRELSVDARFSEISFDRYGAVAVPDRLRDVSFAFNYTKPIDAQWSALTFVQPGWHSATGTSTFSSDAFGVVAGGGVRYFADPTLSWTLGFGYNSLAHGRYRYLPLVGAEWKFHPEWTLSVGFPETAISFQPSDKIKVGAALDAVGGAYHVDRDPWTNSAGKPALSDTSLEFYEIRAGLKASYVLNKYVTFTTNTGWVVNRTFDYRQVGYEVKSRGTPLYVSVGATVRF